MRKFNQRRDGRLGVARSARYVPYHFCTSADIGTIPLASCITLADGDKHETPCRKRHICKPYLASKLPFIGSMWKTDNREHNSFLTTKPHVEVLPLFGVVDMSEICRILTEMAPRRRKSLGLALKYMSGRREIICRID